LDRMTLLKPVFVDVTWGAGGSTSEATLEICRTSQNLCMLETQMHLTCTNLPIETTKKALEQAKVDGIRNILALRGGV
jgi:methylenetetrahydrofolate reductase (NADPH)